MERRSRIRRPGTYRTEERMQPIEEVSDAQLVTSIARWSEVALAEVYRRHAGAVFGLAKRVLNGAAEAEDVTQEVFLRLWNQPDRFDPGRGSLRSFLLAQAHGRAVDQVRSTTSRRQREARDALKTAEAGYDLQHEVWDLAVADQVARAMEALPAGERRAIALGLLRRVHLPRGGAAPGPARGHGQEPDPQWHAAHACRPDRRRREGGRRVMTHEEASELLGAYALDAVDGEELQQLEAHMDTCPRCRAELDTFREVAGAIGHSAEPLPEGLWSSIVSRLPARPADEESPPMPHLAAQSASSSAGSAPPARRRRALAVAALVAVAAAAVVAALAVGLVRADNRVSDLQAASAQRAQTSAVRAALRAPGHEVVTLNSSSGAALARFVVVPDGRGYLLSSHLPALAGHRTYQLWGIIDSRPISLGLLGSSPKQATFTMASSATASALAITAEPAGGAAAPTSPIVASGTV